MPGDRSLVQTLAGLVGLVFLLVGIAGFVPGITTHLYGGLDFAGHDGNAQLLGIFQISVLHNLVHIALGVAGLAFARTYDGVPLDRADDWLHFLIGLGMIAAGVLATRERAIAERLASQ